MYLLFDLFYYLHLIKVVVLSRCSESMFNILKYPIYK